MTNVDPNSALRHKPEVSEGGRRSQPRRAGRTSGSIGRLLLVGAVLLWLVTPLLLGGLITLAVRSHNGSGISLGVGAVLVVGGIAALGTMFGGFGAIVAAVLRWARSRSAPLVGAQTDVEE